MRAAKGSEWWGPLGQTTDGAVSRPALNGRSGRIVDVGRLGQGVTLPLESATLRGPSDGIRITCKYFALALISARTARAHA